MGRRNRAAAEDLRRRRRRRRHFPSKWALKSHHHCGHWLKYENCFEVLALTAAAEDDAEDCKNVDAGDAAAELD